MVRRTLSLTMLLGMALLPTLLWADDRPQDGPRYARRRPVEAGRSAIPRVAEMPTRLRIVVNSSSDGAASTRAPIHGTLLRAADLAGRWAAEEQVTLHGRREYYRVGFFEGLQASRHEPRLGEHERLIGEQDGWFDRDARRQGMRDGARLADEMAIDDAEEQVQTQFFDLDRAPVRDPRPLAPVYPGTVYDWEQPTLQVVFQLQRREVSLRFGERFELYVSDWSRSPWDLYHCPDFNEFYDSGWNDADEAFHVWVGGRYRSVVFRAITQANQRQQFRAAFIRSFQHELTRLYQRQLVRYHHLGVEDGWAYGAAMRSDLAFRQGYRVGFERAVREAAATGFARAYPSAYVDAYRFSFEDWSNNSHPAIYDVRFIDGNDDGVFEPGEAIIAEYELANFGGRDTQVEFVIRGAGLVGSAANEVRLPARSLLTTQNPLQLRIGDWVAPRSRVDVELWLDDVVEVIALDVQYPLQFQANAWNNRRDDLTGRVSVELQVSNVSRFPRDGVVRLRSSSLPGAELTARLEAVPRDGRRSVFFEVEGLRAVDLIAGNVSFEATVVSRDQTQDVTEYQLQGTARDLRNQDLTRLLIRQATTRDVPLTEIDLARGLLISRLEADWSHAVRGNGNAYKRDFKRNGSETALGELLQSYRRERGRIVRNEVFRGISSDILTLSKELPGAHPFLRKFARKLAEGLP